MARRSSCAAGGVECSETDPEAEKKIEIEEEHVGIGDKQVEKAAYTCQLGGAFTCRAAASNG